MSRSELITHSRKTNLSASTVLQSSILTTEMVNPTDALTLTTGAVESSIAESPSSYGSTQGENAAKEEFQRYTAELKSLNASKKGSLQNAANTASNFFKVLRKKKVQTNDINVLLATQELESFAIMYGKTHYKANESNVISKQNYDAVVLCIVYNDVKQWVPEEKHVELNGKTLTNLDLRSRIIAGRVDPTPVGILEENVTISFSYDKGSKEEATPHCVFWNFSIKSELNGSWSSKGCSLVKIVNNEITCSCNHLTNFAVLMQVGGDKEVSPDHKVVLQMITYIGCALSLIGEVLTLITYCVLMDLKQEQIQIRLNLVVAIAIAQIAFLSGIDATETTGVCVFVAALIHFFYLVGFAWMLVEGIYLYLMVVKVFNTTVKMWLFYAASWGLPVVIVVLSIGIASSQDGGVHSYVHGDFCWVSFTNNLVWTFVAPVLVVCLINAVILACVVREIIKMQSTKISDLQKIRQDAKACTVLFPLLGMTWLFGILSVTDAGLVFQYIFTILNSLQGFFIFILHVMKNSDVRAEFDRKKQRWKTSRSIGSSHETRQPSSDISTNKAINSDTYQLDSKQKEAAPLPEFDDHCPVVLGQQKNITPVDT